MVYHYLSSFVNRHRLIKPANHTSQTIGGSRRADPIWVYTISQASNTTSQLQSFHPNLGTVNDVELGYLISILYMIPCIIKFKGISAYSPYSLLEAQHQGFACILFQGGMLYSVCLQSLYCEWVSCVSGGEGWGERSISQDLVKGWVVISGIGLLSVYSGKLVCHIWCLFKICTQPQSDFCSEPVYRIGVDIQSLFSIRVLQLQFIEHRICLVQEYSD